jgi:hypothetical protein
LEREYTADDEDFEPEYTWDEEDLELEYTADDEDFLLEYTGNLEDLELDEDTEEDFVTDEDLELDATVVDEDFTADEAVGDTLGRTTGVFNVPSDTMLACTMMLLSVSAVPRVLLLKCSLC